MTQPEKISPGFPERGRISVPHRNSRLIIIVLIAVFSLLVLIGIHFDEIADIFSNGRFL